MKELTAEKVLENTFNHLNDVLDKANKTGQRQETAGVPPDKDEGGAEEKRKKTEKPVAQQQE